MRRNANAELKEELKEGKDDSEEEIMPEQEVPVGIVTGARRGRPKLPLTWTRVLHITPELDSSAAAHEVFVDTVLQQLRQQNERLTMSSWELAFFPKQFAADHPIETLESYQLSAKQLEKYAFAVTKLRERLRARALRIQKYREPNQEDGISTKTRLQF
jgi:hypothetical protein